MSTTQIQFNREIDNPFSKMEYTLSIYNTASKGSLNQATLENAWKEAKDSEKKSLLISLLFHIGDVDRHHYIFEGKVEKGGQAQREVFRDIIIPFLVDKLKDLSLEAKLDLMKLIAEYTVMDNILSARIVTKKKTANMLKVINMIEVFGVEDVSEYVANIIIRGSLFEKICLSKFLTIPRQSKRTKNKKRLDETIEVAKTKKNLLKLVSEKANLLIEDKIKFIKFSGYIKWRKEYNQNFESVLFSTKDILKMDKEEFLNFLNKVPSAARFRIRNRVMFNDKWGKLKGFYEEFEKFKEVSQKKQRILEDKISQGVATQEEKVELNQVKKDAKVNYGAVTFTSLYKEIVNGTVDRIKVQPIIDNINLPYNTLVFIDDSSSMNSSWGSSHYGFTARQLASFIATITMLKNPDPLASDIVGLFSDSTRIFSGITKQSNSPNSLMRGSTTNTSKKPLIDRSIHFLDNLKTFKSFLDANTTMQGTKVDSIPDKIHEWVASDPNKLEQIQNYPIWTLISDGNFNNMYNPSSSFKAMLDKCDKYFGFKPYILLIDVAGGSSAKITQFAGIENIFIVPPSPNNIELVLSNFKDIDIYDIYMPLQSFYRSNRYQPIKDFALKYL